MNNNAGIRAQFRALTTALWGVVTVTLMWLGVDVPQEVIVAWGVLYFAVVGFGEALYDSRKKPTQNVPPASNLDGPVGGDA